MPGHEFAVGEEFVVIALDAAGQHRPQGVRVHDFDSRSGRSVVTVGERRYEIASQWHLGASRIRGSVNGRPFTAQVQRGLPNNPLAIRIGHNGTRLDAVVLTPRQAQLHALLPYKAPPDMSRFL